MRYGFCIFELWCNMEGEGLCAVSGVGSECSAVLDGMLGGLNRSGWVMFGL